MSYDVDALISASSLKISAVRTSFSASFNEAETVVRGFREATRGRELLRAEMTLPGREDDDIASDMGVVLAAERTLAAGSKSVRQTK